MPQPRTFAKGSIVSAVLLVFSVIGCTNDPSKVILGAWQMEEDQAKVVEFLDDGSLSTKDGQQTGGGRWSMLGDGKLNLEISTPGGSKSFTCAVQFVDNRMILTSEAGAAEKYIRLK